MIALQNVSLRRGRLLLFENASFAAHVGQRVGVVGVNGCGKSSLFSLVRGDLDTDAGEVRVPSDAVLAHVRQESPNTDRSALDYVIDGDRELREALDAIARHEASGETAALPALMDRLDMMDGFTAQTRAGRLLHGLGFATGDAERPVNTFSGGWRMRLNLAQALMCRSDILLLDEPTNHLDLPAILWLERWLKRYTGIVLLISHDRDFLDELCTHVVHIEHQNLTPYTGNYSQFETVRAERLALQQAMHERQEKEIRHIQKYVERFRYKASKARQAQSRLKMLERMEKIAPAHVDSAFHFRFTDPERQPDQLLSLERATLGYALDKPVLEGLRLSLAAGDRVGLLGVNGAGKSTLVKALADGTTLLAGDRTAHRHLRLGYFAQHQLDQINPEESPRWHLERQGPGLREQELRDFLGRFGFQGERVDEASGIFSGGEKARLVLALLVQQRPNLLLLDEPTNHLDLEMRQALSMALLEYSGALLVISHDRHLLRSVCEDLYIVHGGALQHFEDDIDHYPAWLRAQEEAPEGRGKSADSTPRNRKAERRASAERRKTLEPYRQQVKKVERAMEKTRSELQQVEDFLAEESLYTEVSRRDEQAELVRRQGDLKRLLEDHEWSWLEASEALETAELTLTANVVEDA